MVSRKDKTMKRTVSLFLALVLLLTLFGCGKKDGGAAWQEQYDLGVRYLSDGNYEEAIIAFTAAIEIDSKRPEAYLGLADAYTGTGDLDAARKALEDGLVATGDADIQSRLDELSAEAGNLTGQPPFSFQDLEEWGYPDGIDAYTLEREGKIEAKDIDVIAEAMKVNPLLPHYVLVDRMRFYLGDNMAVTSVVIDFDTSEGPRGLRVGMSGESILSLFRCDNSEVLEYLQTGDKAIMAALTEQGQTIYRCSESDDFYDADFVVDDYSDYVYAQLTYSMRNTDHTQDVDMVVRIKDRVVVGIDIYYWNQW